MKYFAKYLPVEGEIKELGDRYITTDYPNEIFKVYDLHSIEDFGLKNKGTKVKLFLCSRDIQVGDIVLCNYIGGKEKEWKVVDKADKSTTNIFIKTALKLGAYKVIGEISPDALSYVKEGQSYDESELELCSSLGEGYDPKYLREIETLKKHHDGIYVKIKGSCGHFH
jgi:hypothetical protein